MTINLNLSYIDFCYFRSKIILNEPYLSSSPLGLLLIDSVRAFLDRQKSKKEQVKGVFPLAAMPITKSLLFIPIFFA